MKALVFGKTGQLARCLADTQPEGLEAVYIDRQSADFPQAPDFAVLLKQHQPQAVINAIAYTAVDQAETDQQNAFAVNAVAVAVLSQACRQAGTTLLHISTDYVFAGDLPQDQAYREDQPTGPQGVYGASKLAGEQAIIADNQQGGRGFIFRTAWVYSPYGKNFLKTMLRLAETRDELGIVADQHGTPTSAHDIARALWQALSSLDQATPGLYHLIAQASTSWHGFAAEIFAQAAPLGWKAPQKLKVILSDAFPTPAKRPSNSRLDTTKLEQAFDIRLLQWQDAIGPVLAQLKQGEVA